MIFSTPKNNADLILRIRDRESYLEGNCHRNEIVLNAMEKVDRGNFVKDKYSAYYDLAEQIGFGQTCSEPSMVSFMSDILSIKKGMKVLEIGTGCGYHAAVTSQLLGEKGNLTSIEYIPELAKLARSNLISNFGSEIEKKIDLVCGDGSKGYDKNAPYDRIYLTAGVRMNSFKPEILAKQLSKEGILLFPENGGPLTRQTYKNGELVGQIFYYSVGFVPLKGENS